MSQWSKAHPEAMGEIASLPLSQQNEALRGAMEHTVHSGRAAAEKRYMNSDEQRADRWERLERMDHNIEDLYTDEDVPEREASE
jgi:hypothetical protein